VKARLDAEQLGSQAGQVTEDLKARKLTFEDIMRKL